MEKLTPQPARSPLVVPLARDATGNTIEIPETAAGWRADAAANIQRSLPEVNATIAVPRGGHWSRRLLAFLGPGYLVSVGYMDPGNWATDLAGGSKFGYTLLSVILLSNLMAILLQALAARLGIATDRDLAQACRATYSRPVNLLLWLACEAAIIACDLAEVIGTAIALKLLFGIPLIGGALITALDAFLLLLLMNKGFRFLEAFVIALLIVIAVCFAIQIVAAAPPVAAMLSGFVPSTEIVTNPEMLYIAIGIIGATVMPHNLYLHSSIVQTRAYERSDEGRRDAIKWATTDSTIALMLALFINAAILIVAAATFHSSGHADVAEIGQAFELLSPLLGLGIASTVFAAQKVMLAEHFRCVHPIIAYSNRTFYKDQVRPLRVPKASERIDPPLVDMHVPGGERDKRDRNDLEAQAIAAEVARFHECSFFAESVQRLAINFRSVF